MELQSTDASPNKTLFGLSEYYVIAKSSGFYKQSSCNLFQSFNICGMSRSLANRFENRRWTDSSLFIWLTWYGDHITEFKYVENMTINFAPIPTWCYITLGVLIINFRPREAILDIIFGCCWTSQFLSVFWRGEPGQRSVRTVIEWSNLEEGTT